jgi:two-component system, OmpR family, sensor kinase
MSLLAIVLVAGLLSAVAVYAAARQEIGTLLDYQLRQMALALRDETREARGVIEVPPHGFDFAIQVSSADGLWLHYSRSRVQLPRADRSG